MSFRSRDGSLLHVKVWEDAGNQSGRILFADEPALIGRTFAMEDDEYRVFGTDRDGHPHLGPAEGRRTRLERSAGELVEVYAGMIDATGAPLLFEAYIPTDRLREDSQSLRQALLPLTLGALLLLRAGDLAVRGLPRPARRPRPAGSQPAARQRRGIVRPRATPHRAGPSRRCRPGPRRVSDTRCRRCPGSCRTGAERGRRIDEAADIVRRDVAALRTLMTDIYPPDLDHRGLAEAVRDLLDQLPVWVRSVADYEVDEPLTASPTTGRLAFRVVREALRNVVKHATASARAGPARPGGRSLLVEVVDDGVGFDTAEAGADGPPRPAPDPGDGRGRGWIVDGVRRAGEGDPGRRPAAVVSSRRVRRRRRLRARLPRSAS